MVLKECLGEGWNAFWASPEFIVWEIKAQREGQDVLKITQGVMVAGLEPRPPGS